MHRRYANLELFKILLGHMTGLEPMPAPRQQDSVHVPPRRFEQLLGLKLRRTRMSYKVLLKQSQESFKKKMATLEPIEEVIKLYPEQPGISDRVFGSVDEVWGSFEEHTSWYNSELVEAVIRMHGSDRDQKNLGEFKNDRSKLIRHMDSNFDQSEKITMILKLEENFNRFSDERLEQVRLTLCDVLETTTCSLDRQEGCVKVTMSIPMEVADSIFPLSPARKKAFHKVLPTLISISCGKFTTNFEVSTAFSL